jgi:excisionase family DNA binding protein
MAQLDRRPLPPASPPSLSITQIIGMLVELRDLACRLIELHQQLIDLLRSQPSEASVDELDLLTVARTAAKLSYDRKTIYRMLQEGTLEAVGRGARLRVVRASVERYINIERHHNQ